MDTTLLSTKKNIDINIGLWVSLLFLGIYYIARYVLGSGIMTNLYVQGALLPILYMIYQKFYEEEKVKLSIKKLIFVTLGYYIINTLTCSGILKLLGIASTTGGKELYANNPILLQILVVGILSPIFEEFVFRGFLFQGLKKECFGSFWAALPTSFVFGICHGNPKQFIYAGLLSFLLCYTYQHEKTLKAPIFIHVASNIFTVLISYFLT